MTALNNTHGDCSIWPNKPHFCNVVKYVQLLCPSLSIAGSFFVIFVIWLFKMYRSYVQRLILALAFSASLQSVSYLVGNIYSHNVNSVCLMQAFMMQYFLWSTLSWVISITVNMVFIVREIEGEKYEYHFHLFSWLNPLVWALIPLILNKYGHAGIWCWVKKDFPMLRFGVWYLPLLIICVLLGMTYFWMYFYKKHLVRTSSTVYRIDRMEENKVYRNEVKPLIAYPLIYIILTVPIFIYRLYDALHPNEEPLFPLLIAAVLSAPSVGSCNAVAYAFFSETIRDLDLKKFQKALYVRVNGEQCKIRHFSARDFNDETVSNTGGTIRLTGTIERRVENSATTDEQPQNVDLVVPLSFHNTLFVHDECEDLH